MTGSGLNTKLQANWAPGIKYFDIVESILKRWPATAFSESYHKYFALRKSKSYTSSEPIMDFVKIVIIPGREDPMFPVVSEDFREIFAVITFTEKGLGQNGKGFNVWSYHLGSYLSTKQETVYYVKNSALVGTVATWENFKNLRLVERLPHFLIEYGHRGILIRKDGTYFLGDISKIVSLNESTPTINRIFNRATSKAVTSIKAIIYNRNGSSKRELFTVMTSDGIFYQLNIERSVLGGIRSIFLTPSSYENKDMKDALVNRDAISITTDGQDYYYAAVNATPKESIVPQARLWKYELFYGREDDPGLENHANKIAAVYIKFPYGTEYYIYYYEWRDGKEKVFLHKHGDKFERDKDIGFWSDFAAKSHLLPYFIIPFKENIEEGLIFYDKGTYSISNIEAALLLKFEEQKVSPRQIPIPRCPTPEQKSQFDAIKKSN